MDADPFFHTTESMRIASREGSVAVFAAESITSPEKTALLGITFPSIKVATSSLALILAPTGVFPAATFCSMTTGNSCAPGGAEAAGFCCPSKVAEKRTAKSTKVDTGRVRVNIEVHPHCYVSQAR
jgi:hypothetical protein